MQLLSLYHQCFNPSHSKFRKCWKRFVVIAKITSQVESPGPKLSLKETWLYRDANLFSWKPSYCSKMAFFSMFIKFRIKTIFKSNLYKATGRDCPEIHSSLMILIRSICLLLESDYLLLYLHYNWLGNIIYIVFLYIQNFSWFPKLDLYNLWGSKTYLFYLLGLHTPFLDLFSPQEIHGLRFKT